MKNTDEYVQTYVPKEAQAEAYKIAEELWNLLTALDKKEQIRPTLRGSREERREELIAIAKNVDEILSSFNRFYDLYLNENKREKFLEFMKDLGLTEGDLAHLLHISLIFMFLTSIEGFRNFMTLILKDVGPKTTLGQLFRTANGRQGRLVKLTAKTGEAYKVASRLDISLRNSLAHLMFKDIGRTIHHYSYEKRGKQWVLRENEIDVIALFKKMEGHSLQRAIAATVIADWYGL